MEKNLKTLALCGVGRMGQIRSDALLEKHQFKVSYVVDPDPHSQRDMVANKLGAKTASSLRDIVQEVDAVMLCTPTGIHYVDIKIALEHKKPVFTEKPVAFTKRETHELYLLAKKMNVPVFTAYNRRAAIPFRELKEKSKPEDIQRIGYVLCPMDKVCFFFMFLCLTLYV